MPITEKLFEMYKEVEYIKKDKRNEGQRYNYVSDEAVMEKIHTACVKVGLISVPTFTYVKVDTIPVSTQYPDGTRKEGTVTHVTLSLDLTILDPSDQQAIHVNTLGEGMDHGDKATAKAMTMAMKYAWMKVLNLSTGDDPEADETVDTTMSQEDPIKRDEVSGAPVTDGTHYLGIEIPNCNCGVKARVWDPNDGKGYFRFYCAKAKTDPKKCSFSREGRSR